MAWCYHFALYCFDNLRLCEMLSYVWVGVLVHGTFMEIVPSCTGFSHPNQQQEGYCLLAAHGVHFASSISRANMSALVLPLCVCLLCRVPQCGRWWHAPLPLLGCTMERSSTGL